MNKKKMNITETEDFKAFVRAKEERKKLKKLNGHKNVDMWVFLLPFIMFFYAVVSK